MFVNVQDILQVTKWITSIFKYIAMLADNNNYNAQGNTQTCVPGKDKKKTNIQKNTL